MIFKDRTEAGKKLAKILSKKNLKNAVIISLLRGGVIVAAEIAKKLKINHFPLAVAKIPAPCQSELAIGALCFDFTYLESRIVNSLNIDKPTIRKQVNIAKVKFRSYLGRFNLKKSIYKKIRNKIVILVDDGIATGSTVKAALLFVKSLKPKKIILASPVAPDVFENIGFDDLIIFHRDQTFSSVSQFYNSFPQVDDDEIKRLLY
ncbi:MAG: phosphoribosyltransferase family protein [Candidatus Roizmanbacteria bacterium]